MHCVVTAGPTFEPMDQVRRLTNFSTGRLGTELARFLVANGHEVTLLRSAQATHAEACPGVSLQLFTTVEDLGGKLAAIAGKSVDAVFHAAAVCDFRFGRIWRRTPSGETVEVCAGKISSREGPLLAELLPTPKLLPRLRGWFPQALVVGWKYEVEGDRTSALRTGARQLDECKTDACVVNGPAYGNGFGLVLRAAEPIHADGPTALFRALVEFMAHHPRSRP